METILAGFTDRKKAPEQKPVKGRANERKIQMQDNPRVSIPSPDIPLGKAIGWGIFGGVTATAVMDIVLMGIFAASGMPPFTCFSIIGDTIANLFSNPGLAGSVPLGMAGHYLIGPVLGGCFGAAQSTIPALRAPSWKKAILHAVVYAEIVSQPLLALTPVLLQMTAAETLLWFGGSAGMHLIWGCAFGTVWGLRRQQAVTAGLKSDPERLIRIENRSIERVKSGMEACNGNPQEMCQKMMAGFAGDPKEG